MTTAKILRMLSMGDMEIEMYMEQVDYDERVLKKIVEMRHDAAKQNDSELYRALRQLEDIVREVMPRNNNSVFMPHRNPNNDSYSKN